MRILTILSGFIWFIVMGVAAVGFIALVLFISATGQGFATPTAVLVQYCLFYGQASQTLMRAGPLTLITLMVTLFIIGNALLFTLGRSIFQPVANRGANAARTLTRAAMLVVTVVVGAAVVEAFGVGRSAPGLLYAIAAAVPLPEQCATPVPVELASAYASGTLLIAGAALLSAALLLLAAYGFRRPPDRLLIQRFPAPVLFNNPEAP